MLVEPSIFNAVPAGTEAGTAKAVAGCDPPAIGAVGGGGGGGGGVVPVILALGFVSTAGCLTKNQ